MIHIVHQGFIRVGSPREAVPKGIILDSSRFIVLTGLVGVILFIAALGCSTTGARPESGLEDTVDTRLESPAISKSPGAAITAPKQPATPKLAATSAISPSPTPIEIPALTIIPSNTPSPSPTLAKIPSPIPTPTATFAQPTAIPIPLLESFGGSVSVVKQVGQLIQQLEWGLINNSREPVTVLAARTSDSEGNVVVDIPSEFIASEWSGGKIAPDSKLDMETDFEIPVTLDELLTYRWIWTVQTQTGVIIVCTFEIDADSCLSSVDRPTVIGDRPDVSGVLLTINGQRVIQNQVAVPIENGYVMVHPMTDADGSYPRRSQVTLGYYPNVAGTQGYWSGVDIVSGSIAEIMMDRDKEVTVTAQP